MATYDQRDRLDRSGQDGVWRVWPLVIVAIAALVSGWLVMMSIDGNQANSPGTIAPATTETRQPSPSAGTARATAPANPDSSGK